VLTKGQQVKIPSETRLDFTLQQPLGDYVLAGKENARAFERGPAIDGSKLFQSATQISVANIRFSAGRGNSAPSFLFELVFRLS